MKTILTNCCLVLATLILYFVGSVSLYMIFGDERPFTRLFVHLVSFLILILSIRVVDYLFIDRKWELRETFGFLLFMYTMELSLHLTIGIPRRRGRSYSFHNPLLRPLWKEPWSEIVPVILVYLFIFSFCGLVYYIARLKDPPPVVNRNKRWSLKSFYKRIRKRFTFSRKLDTSRKTVKGSKNKKGSRNKDGNKHRYRKRKGR